MSRARTWKPSKARAAKLSKARGRILSAMPPSNVAIVVGIDPGKQGGLAALTYPHRGVYQYCPMPVIDGVVDSLAVAEWLLFIWKNAAPVFVGIEEQQIRYGRSPVKRGADGKTTGGGWENANALSNISNYGRLLAAVESSYRLAFYGEPGAAGTKMAGKTSTGVDTFLPAYVAFQPNVWQHALFDRNTYDKNDGGGYCITHGYPTPRKRTGTLKDGITDAFCIASYTCQLVDELLASRGSGA